MKRRDFISLAGTFTGGTLLLPSFLHAFGKTSKVITGQESVVFIQLNGGNDGLNTFVPFSDPLYYKMRPKIGLNKEKLIGKNKGMAFHPALSGFAEMQQAGKLSIIQNVGYPNPIRSHFRSQEIWQTGSGSNEYINQGWLGRYLDLQCKDHQPTAGINIDGTDNLALKGNSPNSITVRNPNKFKFKNDHHESMVLSDNPQLDFVRKVAYGVVEGSADIQTALKKAPKDSTYPKSGLAKNLEWIARLIKGELNTKVYYTALNGFDTHDYQLGKHEKLLTELNDAVYAFYKDIKSSGILNQTTIVIFSEFGRRVADNGKGTDHGTAAPMFIIGGENSGKVIGNNPNLADLSEGDLKYEIDFRSVYASLLEKKLGMDPSLIGIKKASLKNLFG